MNHRYKKIHWTEHAKVKMKQYGLSKYKLLELLSKPERREQGIVEGTTAVMKTKKIYRQLSLAKVAKSSQKAPGEVWLMYKDAGDLRKIISAWRYPGISKPGENIPIPEDIRQELLKIKELV